MKPVRIFILLFSIAMMSLYPLLAGEAEKTYYAVEINGVLCGYTEVNGTKIELGGKSYVNQNMNLFIMLSLFGSEFNTKMNIVSTVDPVTKKCTELKGTIEQGNIKSNFGVEIKEGKAFIKSSFAAAKSKTIEMGPDILFGSDEVYGRVKKEFLEKNASEINLDILEAVEAEVQNSSFKKTGEERINLAGKNYDAVIIEQHNNKSGVNIKYWVAPDLDYYAMIQVQNRKVYLSDRTVVDRIKVASMDGSILTKTNKAISDVQAISYMKIKVKIQPTGITLKPEDLTVPGQKFDGTIKDNLIDGVIEINHKKYSGEDAPPFPPDFKNNESLKTYLLPSDRVESDDPLLIGEAERITEGAENSWDAAKRLSKWVAEKIHYAIPGGGSARGAYDIRAGECGAHSMLLTAFCRAVGIPARVVFGGMYVPNMGGAFGQHAWTEIYMGSSGWIPVDATAFETDFVDAGHIRISDRITPSSSFNAKSIEILDYKLNGGETAESSSDIYSPYLGKYTHKSGKTFEVVVKDGNLSVDIPGKMVLPFNEADDRGRRYCKLSGRLCIEFTRGEDDSIDQMIFHELISMIRQPDSAKVDQEIPDKFKPYVGDYLFAQINAVFKVSYKENTLEVYDPTEKKTVRLQPPDKDGVWLDEFNKNSVKFETGSDGKVKVLIADIASKFKRN